MSDMITNDDILKLQESLQQLEKIIDGIMQMNEKLVNVFNKPEKEIDNEDIYTLKVFDFKISELRAWMYASGNPVETIKSKIKKIHENKETNNLGDRENLVIEENEGNFLKAQELLNQIEVNSQKISKFSAISNIFHSKLNKKEQEDKKDEIKDDFLEPQDNISCVIMNYNGEEKVITAKEMDLMKKGILLTPAYTIAHDVLLHGENTYYEVKHYTFDELNFTEYENATLEGKQSIIEKEEKILAIKNSKSPKYDIKGNISIPLSEIAISNGEIIPKSSASLETTPRELANAGLDPEDFDFEPNKRKSLINSKIITQLDHDLSLTSTEVGGIKEIVRNLLDKFQGKGEK